MHPIAKFISNPVKVTVGVILVVLFGLIAAFQMPMQLAPNVERPRITVRTNWPGASPQEVEKDIVKKQEEQLKSVVGVTKMTSESSASQGSITMEFEVGTNMQESILRVNKQLQQVREYPKNADKPVILTSGNTDRAIAWFILSTRPPTIEELDELAERFPDLRDEITHVQNAYTANVGLAMYRLREFAEKNPQTKPYLPAEKDVTTYRKFAEENIESAYERVAGVSNSNVRGGQDPELQVIVDPDKLAARGLTIADIRNVLQLANKDTSGGDFPEGKRRWVVRTLGQFRNVDEVANQIVQMTDGVPTYLHEVAKVQLGLKKPSGFVRRFGVSNIAVNVERESGSNVIEVMEGLRAETKRLNETVLKRKGLVLTQVYDETLYINSAIGLVNQNIVLGSALTVIVLMLFLHIGSRTLIFIPILAASAVAALLISPWFFVLTLMLILAAGIWFARGTLVVAVAIPISIIGTFLMLQLLGRTLNVISLAGLAFAVGMLVDNAVVVLENIYRHNQLGESPADSARAGVLEVWGAVLASTLTTLFVFLPVIFLQGEAGQLFADIALAISSAVGLSLIVSVIVIPTGAARILQQRIHRRRSSTGSLSWIESKITGIGQFLTRSVIAFNRWVQSTVIRRIAIVIILVGSAFGLSYLLLPELEYLPAGNRNLIICRVLPPPGYNVNELADMGAQIEERLRPYWDVDDTSLAERPTDFPPIGDFFYVARGRSIFLGLRAKDPLKARKLIELVQKRVDGLFPGSFVVASQASIFGRGLSGGRTIEVEVVGPKLNRLVDIGKQIIGQVKENFPANTQTRPVPSLDLSSPELHVRALPIEAFSLDVDNSELGETVDALVDGTRIGDYYVGGEQVDFVILGSEKYEANTQDLREQYIATPNLREPVRLDSLADVKFGSGPEQVNHSERQRTITIEVSPPDDIPMETAIGTIQNNIVQQLEESGQLEGGYQIILSGTADKLAQTWTQLRWNLLLAILITYLLMCALFESFVYPMVIMVSVPMGAVGGILGLKLLGFYLQFRGESPQSLDVLTMLGFVILIGTVVNNAILIVHQALIQMRTESQNPREAVLESIRTRIRPIFMTTITTVFGLSPLVFFPGAGSELYRGLGSVVLGGLVFSTIFTLVLIPTLFTLTVDLQNRVARRIARANGGSI